MVGVVQLVSASHFMNKSTADVSIVMSYAIIVMSYAVIL